MRTVHRSTRRAAPVVALVFLLAAFARDVRAQVSVGGVVYAQYQYSLANDSVPADSFMQHVNNFDITRAYINVTGRFTGGIGTRVTGDIYQNADGSRTYRLKYAYVTYTPEGSPLTFKIGQMHTPLLDWEEALWDYRMQGGMAMERGSPVTDISYVSSSDFGAGVDGKWNADQLNMQVGVYNGENYNKAVGDNRKDLMGRVSYRLMNTDDGSRVGGLRLTFYGQYGKPTSGGERSRFLGMVSYRSMDLTLAAEYAVTKDSVTGRARTTGGVGTAAASPERSGRVISVFGVYHFPHTRVSVIGRLDVTDPETGDSTATSPLANKDQTTRLIAGVAYQLTPNLRLIADLDLLSFQSGFNPATSLPAYIGRQSAFFQAMFTF